MGDVRNNQKKIYSCPTCIIPEDASQENVYEKIMVKHIQNFLDGYSINVMAYGQTGSGKTYTMIGPYGSFKKYPDGEL